MSRMTQRRNVWRMKWLWGQSSQRILNEQFCPECGLAYHDGLLPKEVAYFDSGSVNVVVYPGWGNDVLVRFGRMKAGGKRLYLSEFIHANELEDVRTAMSRLESWLQQSGRKIANRR